MKIRSAVRAALISFMLAGGNPWCGPAVRGFCDQETAAGGMWRERGFADLADGTFGNAGQNLYVSKAGVLQRIFRFDFNGDGWVDLPICNSQDHWEKPPAYIFSNPLAESRPQLLPSDGSRSGASADLNADGRDDLILGMLNNGVRSDLNAFVYFAHEEGYGERYQLRLPAPRCRSVTAGDFNGDGRCDVAMLLSAGLRLFYQTELGLEPRRFVDVKAEGEGITAADLDRDGKADLAVRLDSGDYRIYWGDQDGLDSGRTSVVANGPGDSAAGRGEEIGEKPTEEAQYAEYVEPSRPLAVVVSVGGKHHLLASDAGSVRLIPITGNRSAGSPLRLACPRALSAAVGDVNGDGHPDLALACQQRQGERERSWIYWGGRRGWNDARKTPLASFRACDVAVSDLDGDGCAEVVLCQSHTQDSFSHVSLIYRGSPQGPATEAVRLPGEDARRVLLARVSPAGPTQVVLVNQMARGKLGNPDASLYLGGPDGFSAERRWQVASWGAVEALGCDLNDDALPDLVLANASENSVHRDPGSYLFLGRAGESPYQPSAKLPTTRAHGAACADLNRDGFLDLVFCGFDNPDLLFFYGDSAGFTRDPVRLRMERDGVVYRDPRWIHLADLNGDARLDLVVPMILDDRSLVFWGSAEGYSMERSTRLSVERAACARTADLDADGDLDLLLGGHNVTVGAPHDSFLHVFWNGPAGLRQDRRTMLPSAGINSMSVADFNRDGALDVFVGSYHAGLTRDTDSYLYWNRAGKGFSEADFQRLFTHSASGSMAADFNEDGWTDLAIAYHKVWGDHVGYSEVWWNGPDGFNPRRVTRLPTKGPHGMTVIELGNQRDRGPEEYYESSPRRLPDGAAATKISWMAQTPSKTWVKAQLRWAATKAELNQAAWHGPDGPGTWFVTGQAVNGGSRAGQWVQYRLALGAVNAVATPRVTEVSVEYGKSPGAGSQ